LLQAKKIAGHEARQVKQGGFTSGRRKAFIIWRSLAINCDTDNLLFYIDYMEIMPNDASAEGRLKPPAVRILCPTYAQWNFHMPSSLTDAVVSGAKPQKGQSGWREISDGGCRGLLLLVSPKGEKAWGVRFKVAGKRQRHTLGGYPAVSLNEARKRARDYLSAARDGARPEEVDARRKAATMTTTDAHDEYIKAMAATLRPHTKRLKEDMFKHHIEPKLGRRLVASIGKIDIAELAESVVAKGLTTQANRVYSEIMALLRWCEQKGYVAGVPAIRRRDIRKVGAAKEKPRARTLDDTELAALWNMVGGMGDLTRDFTRLLILTGQRLSEVREMRWDEVDRDNALWVIPADRYKTGIDQVVPLSDAVMAILNSRWTEGLKGYVLAGTKEGQAFNGHTSAMKRIHKKIIKNEGKADFTWHDLRRTMRSGLSRLGIDDQTAEMVLGHMPQGMQKVYDMHDRVDERRDALKKWAEKIALLLRSKDNVTQFDPTRTRSAG
jgi:integrase